MIALSAEFLRGSYPPLVTPFRDGSVDYEAYAALVSTQVEDGSHGVVVCGTTAEPSSLTLAERKRLLETALRVAKGRIPVVAATGTEAYETTCELSAHAESAGADALLVVTPYYSRPPQRGLVEYYVALGKRTSLPLMVYHIPGRSAVSVTLETLEAIASALPHFVGMKHAVNDLNFVTQVLDRLGADFRIFAGLEELSFPILAIGGAGLMNAVGNIAPRAVAELYELAAAGQMEKARAAHYALAELNAAVFFDTNPIPMKYMMKRLGILETNEHRLPMVPATAELEGRLNGVLERAGLRPRSAVVA